MTVTRFIWLKLIVLRYYRDMGLRVLFYALLSVAAALISPLANSLIVDHVGLVVDFSSVTPILTILATSMLAVSTFSLNIMVTAHRAAADVATPRMHRILLQDTTTQSVLAAFIGAFVFSLASLLLFRIGFYSKDAAATVTGITTLVVIWVILSLLRWIDHLTTLGSLESSLRSARHLAAQALRAHARAPGLGATALTGDVVLPTSKTPLRAPKTGYVQLIDMPMLEGCLPDHGAVYLDVRPGAHILVGQTIGQVSGAVGSDIVARLSRAFTFGDVRTHEQDAEFGLIVLSEIASKALSPGINDAGTAMEAMNVLTSLVWDYARDTQGRVAATTPKVFAPVPGPDALMEAAFGGLARDGADNIAVAMGLRHTLLALSRSDNPDVSAAAIRFAETALVSAREAGLSERDLDQLRSIKLSLAQ